MQKLICLLLFQILTVIGIVLPTYAMNHSSGLHLQTPKGIFDLKRSDMEDCEVFQTNAETASIMIKLKGSAAERLRKLTEKSVDETVVWIWNGRAISVEKLSAPLEKDFTVNNFNVFEADEFKKKFEGSTRNF